MIDEVNIGDHYYSRNELLQLQRLMFEGKEQIKSINVGCNGQYKVDLGLLNKIIERIK